MFDGSFSDVSTQTISHLDVKKGKAARDVFEEISCV